MEKVRKFLGEYYTADKTVRQQYDLVFPESASGSTGLVLCIHGGGWFEGSKDAYTGSLVQLCEEKGVAAAAMNYRYVCADTGFAEILDDITSVLYAVKEKGAQYGVDFDRVLLTGISAGGHLSLLYAYTRKASAPVKPVCVVELCGPTDLENEFYYSEKNRICAAVGTEYFRGIISRGIAFEINPGDFDSAVPALKKYSPVNYVCADTVPTVFGHGDSDDIVPYRNAQDLDAKLTQYGVEHTFITFPRSGHGCEDKESMSEIMRLFFEYAVKYLK